MNELTPQITVKLKNKLRLKFILCVLPLLCGLGLEKTTHKLKDYFLQDAKKDIERYVDIKVYLDNERIK